VVTATGARAAEPGFAALHGGDASVVLLPSLGGRIRDVTLVGRQWLWHNPDVPFTSPGRDARFEQSVPAGGFDECFPTIASCRLPSWVTGAAGARLAERGALWAQRCDLSIDTGEAGNAATCRWFVEPLPFLFTRTIVVRADGVIRFSYSATNAGAHRLPFLWAAQPVFPLTRGTRIVLPTGARTRVWMDNGLDLATGLSQHSWPRVRAGGTLVDVSRPGAIGRRRFACTLFVELPRTECTVGIEEGRARLEMRVHGREISHVGIWINHGALGAAERREPAFRWRRTRRYATVTLAPCLGAPEALADALGAWETARWIEPETSARWSMEWRGVGLDGEGARARGRDGLSLFTALQRRSAPSRLVLFADEGHRF
jgi:hypothetical protein